MRTTWGSATDRGRVRALNEDALLAYPPVFLVADGMGGHAAGDVASRLVVEEFTTLAGRTAVSADEIHACFHHVAQRLRRSVPEGRTAGTTVAGVAVVAHEAGSYWLVFNIGDSRVYRLADGALEQISVDHSVVQELLDEGAIDEDGARDHPDRHVVTRAVGTGAAPEPDYWMMPAVAADRVLVCSDGLTSELGDTALAEILRTVTDPQVAAQALVDAALGAGGRDNVTAVVVDVAAVAGDTDTGVTLQQDEASAAGARVHAAPVTPAPAAAPAVHAPTAPAMSAHEAEPWDEVLHGDTVPRPTSSEPSEVQP